ncbi:hypothetical protein C8J56DRAFT_248291, partial [Mycena floridula]
SVDCFFASLTVKRKGFLNDKKLTSKKAASSVPKTTAGSYQWAPAAIPVDSEYKRPLYGVVEGLPACLEGYQTRRKEEIQKEIPADTVHPDDQLMTTQPPQKLNATQESSPDGWAECYMSGYVKRQLLETPGYPAQIPHHVEPVHRLTEIPNKGWSMVAAETLRAGDIILCERPIIVVPAVSIEQLAFPDYFTESQRHQASLYEREKRTEMLFARVPSWNQKAYKELFNSHDTQDALLGILRTNGFQFGLQDKAEDLRGAYPGVFNQLSRLNHSCMPNVEHHWNTRSFPCSFGLPAISRKMKSSPSVIVLFSNRRSNVRKSSILINSYVHAPLAATPVPQMLVVRKSR